MNLVKNKPIPYSKWPLAVQNLTEEEIELIYTPWSDHDVKIPDNYQCSIIGELPPIKNYLGFEEHSSKKLQEVIDKSYAQLRGISATGKGTRIAYLIQVLIENFGWRLKFLDDVPIWNNLSKEERKEGKEPPKKRQYVGIEFPELNLIILGVKVVRSNKSRLLSITGADSITANMSHETLFWLLSELKDYNLIYEGYTGLDNGKLDLEYQYENNSQENFFYRFYKHDSKELMLERFKSRSYHVAKGDSAFSQNENHSTKSYENNLSHWERLIDSLGLVDMGLEDSTNPPEEFVIDYLKFLGLDGDSLYSSWKNKYPLVRLERDFNLAKENYDTYWYLWKFLDQEISKGLNNES